MRYLCAAVAAVLLIGATPAASNEVQFCSEWNTFEENTKGDFVVTQSQAYLTQWKPKHWIQVSACFRREAPRWIFRIDGACNADGPANFDVGLTMGALVATIFVQCSAEVSSGGSAPADERARDSTEYRSNVGRYSIRYGATWSPLSEVREPGVDMTLQCASAECGIGSTISFGTRYDPHTATASASDILALASSELLTAQVRASPLVSAVEVHEEGKTTLGLLPAYQVRMTVRFANGLLRIRHTFFTFSRGYWYNVSLHADPEKYKSALRSAKHILSSFSPL